MHNNAQTHDKLQLITNPSLEHPLAVARIRRITTALDITLALRGSRHDGEVLFVTRVLLLQPQRDSRIVAVRCRRDVAVLEKDHTLTVWLWRVGQTALFDFDDARVGRDAR